MGKTIDDILIEFVALCDTLQLEYAIMGGIAVRVHGIPRPTYDVDIQVSILPSQMSHFLAEVERQGYTVAEPFWHGWRDRVGGMPVIKLRSYLESGQGIDVDIFLNETPFQQAMMQRRLQVEWDERVIQFVTPEDLVLMKLLANRPRDLGDVADILFVQGQLDTAYMVYWAQQLNITDRLEAALKGEEGDDHDYPSPRD
jgi:hypothetical protein